MMKPACSTSSSDLQPAAWRADIGKLREAELKTLKELGSSGVARPPFPQCPVAAPLLRGLGVFKC